MAQRRFVGIMAAMLAFGSWVIGGVHGAEPTKLASSARFDVMADEAAGSIDQALVIAGQGTISRPNWLTEPAQGRTYTVSFPVSRLGWRSMTIAFTPARDGAVTLSLMGPWEEASKGVVYRQDIEWDDIQATGGRLANGGFESGGGLMGWEGERGKVVRATHESPAHGGTSFARTWHNNPLSAKIAVQGGQQVRIVLFARAARPEDFREMPRVSGRDTPAHKALARFRRGANLGNGLEVPPGQTWGEHYTPTDLRLIREQGFDHARIPAGWHHYTGPGPEFRIQPEFFTRVDTLVNAGLEQGLSILINIHHFDDFTTNPKAQTPKFKALWDQIAAHYAHAPDGLAFELLNEPKDAATTEVMNQVVAETLPVIRRSNPRRTIFVGPGRWNSIGELPAFTLPGDDQNLIVTVHNYDPFYFTHQSATWAGDDVNALAGVVFPGPPKTPLTLDPRLKASANVLTWVKAYNTTPAAMNPSGPHAFQGLFDQAQEWSLYYGRPIHLGEFGAFSAADPVSRAHYYQAVREAAEKAGFGWAIWDWKAGFRYWNQAESHPEPGLHEALMGPTK